MGWSRRRHHLYKMEVKKKALTGPSVFSRASGWDLVPLKDKPAHLNHIWEVPGKDLPPDINSLYISLYL